MKNFLFTLYRSTVDKKKNFSSRIKTVTPIKKNLNKSTMSCSCLDYPLNKYRVVFESNENFSPVKKKLDI